MVQNRRRKKCQLTVAGDEGDDDGSAGGRALHQDGEEDGDHQAHDRVSQQRAALKDLTCKKNEQHLILRVHHYLTS